MTYNFDEIIERRITNCLKWNRAAEDVLPMWVADMDFKAPEPVLSALRSILDHGVFGYTIHPKSYYNAIINWFHRKHKWELKQDWILFCPGIVPALNHIVKAFLKQGEKVIIQAPVYHPFYRVVENNGCKVALNPLVFNGEKYEINYAELESLAKNDDTKMLFLCSPHNPVGRVWTKEELTKVGEICIKHNVLVVSDEIHCDLIYPGYTHIPFASLSEEFSNITVTCTAPSKTFNIAGLQVSNIIIENPDLRVKVKNTLAKNEIGEPNIFGVEALIAAYDNSEDWLEQLLVYLAANFSFLKSFISERLSELKVIEAEATYLIWIDCRKLGLTPMQLNEFLIKDAKLLLNNGEMFGQGGEGFIRMNIACPRELLIDGLTRLENALKNSKR